MNKEIEKELSRLYLLRARYKNKLSMCPLEIKKEEISAFYIVNYIKDLKHRLEEKNKIIDDVANFIEKGDLLYLASKCSIVYRDNIEVVAIYDRLKELSEILERGKDE